MVKFLDTQYIKAMSKVRGLAEKAILTAIKKEGMWMDAFKVIEKTKG